MTRPNKLVQSSDYLAIAKVIAQEYTLSIPSGTTPAEKEYTFTTKSSPASLEQTMIKDGSNNYVLASDFSIYSRSGTIPYRYRIRLSRINSTTLAVLFRCVSQAASSPNVSYPAHTFTIKVTTSRPPNIL